ncbi:hypothetical protein TNCV_4158991 [Trichonephila clavipes]|nr:hypothetical protein TNCV_4158991 [Trichonephila clavipes]
MRSRPSDIVVSEADCGAVGPGSATRLVQSAQFPYASINYSSASSFLGYVRYDSDFSEGKSFSRDNLILPRSNSEVYWNNARILLRDILKLGKERDDKTSPLLQKLSKSY